MYNKQYYPGDRVPDGGTKYYIMKHGSFERKVDVIYMFFPEFTDFPGFENPSQDYYYIKAC
jgi:hypothetical protein